MSIDDLVKNSSCYVAEELIGRTISNGERDYVISKTKAYRGKSQSKTSQERLQYGHLMVFNIRGNAHVCISTGTSEEQNYVFIAELLDGDKKIKSAKGVSDALDITTAAHTSHYSDYFSIKGKTKQCNFTPGNGEGETCIGIYELKQ